MTQVYFDATRIISDNKGKVYHGGGYFGFRLLHRIMGMRDAYETKIIWKKGYEAHTDLEKRACGYEKAAYLFVDSIAEVEYDPGSILFLPLYYFPDKKQAEELKKIRRKNGRIKIVATIHDTRIFLNYTFDPYNQYYTSGIAKYLGSYLKGCMKAKRAEFYLKQIGDTVDCVYTVSNYSEQEIKCRSKIKSIHWFYQDIDLDYTKAPVVGLKEKKFLLFVSGNRKEKNFARTLDAYLKCIEEGSVDLPLCVTGNEDAVSEIMGKVAGSRIELCRKYVRCLGYVSEQEMQWLYSECRFLLYTSKYEGFGLPACNALLYGTPVLASNVSSIPEVCGAAGCYADPYSIESISDAIRMLSNEEKYKKIRQEVGRYAPILQNMIDFGSDMMARKLAEL